MVLYTTLNCLNVIRTDSVVIIQSACQHMVPPTALRNKVIHDGNKMQGLFIIQIQRDKILAPAFYRFDPLFKNIRRIPVKKNDPREVFFRLMGNRRDGIRFKKVEPCF